MGTRSRARVAGLAERWQELDDFEGAEYRRILLPVYDEDASASLVAVANIYEIAH